MRQPILMAVALVMAAGASVWAEQPAAPPAATSTNAPAMKIAWRAPEPPTRADLGQAYMRLERVLAANPQTPERLTELEKRFDRLTALFFRGDFAGAIKAVDEMTQDIARDLVPPDAAAAERLAMSLRVIVSPAVRLRGDATPIEARVVALYPVELPDGATFELSAKVRTWRSDPAKTLEAKMRITPDASRPLDVRLTLPAPMEIPTDAAFVEVYVNGQRGSWTPLTLTATPIAAIREGFIKRLDALPAISPTDRDRAEWAGLIAAARARAELLVAEPSAQNSAEFLANPLLLIGQVETEVTALERGDNPFKGRTGDYWSGVGLGGGAVLPVRVYVPPKLDQAKPAPLLLAFHGAGGDENLFMEGYGAGLIKRLADERGFIVFSPRTEVTGSSPAAFAALLAAARRDYPIDPDRVYAVGHSMGAGLTALLAGSQQSELAAVACLAGGPRWTPKADIVPTLVIGAEFDPIIPAAGLQAAAERGVKAGAAIEYRLAKGHGHSLMVGSVLGEAVDWLLSKKRAAGGAGDAR